MSPRWLLALSLLVTSSCVAEDKEQAIFDYLNKEQPEQAIAVLPIAECERHVDACAKLGVGLFQYEQHIDLGKQYLDRGAAAGHPRGKVVLGNFLIEGAFSEKDVDAGIQLLREAVELGASEGMYYLAFQYHQGVNIERDDLKALDLYERASSAGHIHAPYNAGVLHWQLYQDCEVTEKYFALGATYTQDALKALDEIRTQEPCASVLAEQAGE